MLATCSDVDIMSPNIETLFVPPLFINDVHTNIHMQEGYKCLEAHISFCTVFVFPIMTSCSDLRLPFHRS